MKGIPNEIIMNKIYQKNSEINGNILNLLNNNENNIYNFDLMNNINKLSTPQQNNNLFNNPIKNEINNFSQNSHLKNGNFNNYKNNFKYQINNGIIHDNKINNNFPPNMNTNNLNTNFNLNINNNTIPKVNQLMNPNNNFQNLNLFHINNNPNQNFNHNHININAQIQNKINNELIKSLLFNHNLNSQISQTFINNNNINNKPNKNSKTYNHNQNKSNRKKNNNRNNNNNNIKINQIKEKDLSDAQLDHLFNQFYSYPKEGCPLMNIIIKKGVSFFINLAKTIKGSRYLQNILNTNHQKEPEVDFITKIICLNYHEIMCDYYGNYFLQLFFLHCNSKNRLDILNSLKNDYVKIANDICGNHSLQCLISLQSTNEEKEIIKLCIIDNLKELCFGVNSSHVISKIIKCIKESERQYINAFIINNLKPLCFDQNGICIIKEFIYNIKSNLYIKLIITNFEKEITNLTLNQFGNFAIQEAIKFLGYNYCKNIINSLIKNIVKFSISKFSSNVIDFLLEYLSKKEFHKFCISIHKIFLKENNFKEMIKHKYSIYVIENSLELLIKIDENYYINSMKNNLGNSFNNRKASMLSNSSNNDEEIENDSDEIIIEGEFSFQNFSKLKQKIFQYIENNSAAKEKKKILSLIKTYKHRK